MWTWIWMCIHHACSHTLTRMVPICDCSGKIFLSCLVLLLCRSGTTNPHLILAEPSPSSLESALQVRLSCQIRLRRTTLIFSSTLTLPRIASDTFISIASDTFISSLNLQSNLVFGHFNKILERTLSRSFIFRTPREVSVMIALHRLLTRRSKVTQFAFELSICQRYSMVTSTAPPSSAPSTAPSSSAPSTTPTSPSPSHCVSRLEIFVVTFRTFRCRRCVILWLLYALPYHYVLYFNHISVTVSQYAVFERISPTLLSFTHALIFVFTKVKAMTSAVCVLVNCRLKKLTIVFRVSSCN